MLTIVIPVYNELHHTKQTIETLMSCTYDFTLVIVDDGCTDGTAEWASGYLQPKMGDRLFYIKNPQNLGVNGSWNVGLKKAMDLPSDHICIANNDLVFTRNWDKPLIDALDSGGYSLVSPYSTEQSLPADWPQGKDRHTNPVHIDILGACFMFRKELIEEIGYFPPQMRHYFGDNWIMDFARQAGRKVGHVFDSYIHHCFCISSSKLDNNHWFKVDGDAYNELCRNNRKYDRDGKEVNTESNTYATDKIKIG